MNRLVSPLRLVFLIAIGAIAWPGGCTTLLSRSIVEELDHPTPVEGCTEQGLVLKTGKLVRIPDVDELPCGSAVLQEVTRRGVEIDSAGRVLGLVNIHHWCGNDPVRYHVARVDIGRMLTFFETDYGEPQFTETGWNISQYVAFKAWVDSPDAPRGDSP